MENGSFQTPFSEVSGLDFREELPPTPNRAPTAATSANVKSSTVEALLAQNEDLMARLKVTLRRLTALENENDQLRDLAQATRTENASLSDQLLVWREKENFWQLKNGQLENQIQSIRARFPELESMEEKIERYKKYHEKIRLQVKPYIQQLKAYAQNLTLEIRKLNSEIEEKEMRRQDIERRLLSLRLEVDDELRRQDEQSRQLVSIFEEEKARLHLELTELRKLNDQLELKADKLDSALMRQDELENLVIALRRSKEEADQAAREEIKKRENELRGQAKQITEDRCKIEDLESKLKATSEESSRNKHRADLMEEQLTSLRYLWSNKCEEIEGLQARLQSLEKLNHELSQRLNQARKGEASL